MDLISDELNNKTLAGQCLACSVKQYLRLKDNNMTIRDLIRETQCDTIMNMISLHYGTEHISKFEVLYNNLKNNADLPCESIMTISINAYREADNSDDMILAESFNENDNSLYFDVSALADDDDMVYSIAVADKSEFLDYRVSEKTLG